MVRHLDQRAGRSKSQIHLVLKEMVFIVAPIYTEGPKARKRAHLHRAFGSRKAHVACGAPDRGGAKQFLLRFKM